MIDSPVPSDIAVGGLSCYIECLHHSVNKIVMGTVAFQPVPDQVADVVKPKVIAADHVEDHEIVVDTTGIAELLHCMS
jgi:hypothetical protein